MSQAHRSSLVPLTGAVFVLLFVASFIVVGEAPSADDPVDEIVSFYTESDTEVTIGSLLGALGAVLFLFFVSTLRSYLRTAEGGTGWLSNVAFAGGIVASVGMLIFAGLGFTLADSSDALDPAATQAINALSFDLFFPAAGGILTLLVASGLLSIRTGALPRWLGWAALVIAVAIFTPVGFVAFLASVAWVLVVSIVLVRGGTPAPSRL
jgi:hypothetical protein